MGLWELLKRLLGISSVGSGRPTGAAGASSAPRSSATAMPKRRPRLVPLRYADRHRTRSMPTDVDAIPYEFAQFNSLSGGYLDLCRDADPARLQRFGLPVFEHPGAIADWLGLPLQRVAWLTHRFEPGSRPPDVARAHYHYRWLAKRSGGRRLIEAPKPMLKGVQNLLLREVLELIPPHPAAHGFVAGRSIVTNATPHVGQAVVVKLDLQDFYASVRFNRVTAIFRSVGYCRESAIWLARLCTSSVPGSMPFPEGDASALSPYLRRHLPQGAPTSPALANLSAYSLDIRLTGLARSFGANYTRYADDLTFSGSRQFDRSLSLFIPLAMQVIRDERFQVNPRKRRVLRQSGRQTVTGVVVNDRLNFSRPEFDRLKSILHHCTQEGPSTQNREHHANFAAHLRGRIAHVQQVAPDRGQKLLNLYDQIDWNR